MMSVDNDPEFEDQIERMKLKNQRILEKFQASEEDRRLAESTGSTITKEQNVQIHTKNNVILRTRNMSKTSRPKSFSGNIYDDGVTNELYYQNNENKKNGKLRNLDQIAYRDYAVFQSQFGKKTQNKKGNNHGDSLVKGRFHEYNKMYMKQQQPTEKGNIYNETMSFKFSKENRSTSMFNCDNDNYYYQHRSSNSKNGNYNSNGNNNNYIPKNYQKKKQKRRNSKDYKKNSYKYTNSRSDSNINNGRTMIDDEYIDDTLEDLEQYRLKVDLENFTVIDPDSEDPILLTPLKSWSKSGLDLSDDQKVLQENNTNEPIDLFTINKRAKDYLNLGNEIKDDLHLETEVGKTSVENCEEIDKDTNVTNNDEKIDSGDLLSLASVSLYDANNDKPISQQLRESYDAPALVNGE